MHRAQKSSLRTIARPVPRHADLPARRQREARNVERVGARMLAAHVSGCHADACCGRNSCRNAAPTRPRRRTSAPPPAARRARATAPAPPPASQVMRSTETRAPPAAVRRTPFDPAAAVRAGLIRHLRRLDQRRAQQPRASIAIDAQRRQPPVEKPGIGLGEIDAAATDSGAAAAGPRARGTAGLQQQCRHQRAIDRHKRSRAAPRRVPDAARASASPGGLRRRLGAGAARAVPASAR